MSIIVPTIDSFTDTTVMRCIRKIVDYIINTLVPGHNTDIQTVTGLANNAQNTANEAKQLAQDAQADADANATKIQQIITQFNVMVDYVGTDVEINTGTAPQKIQ